MKHKPRFDQLVAACHYEQGERQYEAMIAINHYYPDRASKVFIELLDSSDMTVRFKAAKLLGEPGEKDIEVVAAALIKALDDSSYMVRSEALKSLIRLRYPSVQKYALLLLHSDSAWQVRSTAAEAVGFLNDPTALAEIEATLQEEASPAVRASAVRSIGVLASSDYAQVLERYLSTEAAPAVRRELFAALYRLGDRTQLQSLLSLLHEASSETALSILFTIHFLIAYRPPASLAADAPAIRKAVTDLATHFPTFSFEAQSLLGSLAQLTDSRS